MIDVNTATFEQLQERFAFLGERLSLISVERAAIDAEITRRQRAVAVKNRVMAMTPEQKAALRAELDA